MVLTRNGGKRPNIGLVDAYDSADGFNSSSCDSSTTSSESSSDSSPAPKRRRLSKKPLDTQTESSEASESEASESEASESDDIVQQPQSSGKAKKSGACRIPIKIPISEYLEGSPDISDCRKTALLHAHEFKEYGPKKRVTVDIDCGPPNKRRKTMLVRGDVKRIWVRSPVPKTKPPLRPQEEHCILRPELLEMKPCTIFMDFMRDLLEVLQLLFFIFS